MTASPLTNDISPYLYKILDHREVELFNRLFEKRPDLSFQLGVDNYAVQLEPEGDGPPLNTPLAARVRINKNITLFLYPEEKLLNNIMTDVATGEDLKTLSPELRGIAMETALERILDRIDQLSGSSSTIDRLAGDPNTDPAQPHIYLSLTRKKDAQRCRGVIRTDVRGLEWIAARIGRLSPPTSHRFNNLPATGDIEIARMALTRAEINSLERNDILLTEESGVWEERELLIRFSPDCALGGNIVEPNRILIQEVIQTSGKRGPMKKTRDKAKPSKLPVDDIPVQLAFDIGHTEIPMGELKHLQPGYTIQLDESITMYNPVTIKANGVAVGSGEIVLIGEQLGIRILAFNKEMDGVN